MVSEIKLAYRDIEEIVPGAAPTEAERRWADQDRKKRDKLNYDLPETIVWVRGDWRDLPFAHIERMPFSVPLTPSGVERFIRDNTPLSMGPELIAYAKPKEGFDQSRNTPGFRCWYQHRKIPPEMSRFDDKERTITPVGTQWLPGVAAGFVDCPVNVLVTELLRPGGRGISLSGQYPAPWYFGWCRACEREAVLGTTRKCVFKASNCVLETRLYGRRQNEAWP